MPPHLYSSLSKLFQKMIWKQINDHNNDLNVIQKCLCSSMEMNYSELTDHLIHLLLSDHQSKLKFENAVELLKAIKLYKKPNPKIANDKADKSNDSNLVLLAYRCNTVLIDQLTQDPNEQNVDLYCRQLHNHLDKFYPHDPCSDYIDSKLIDLIAPILVNSTVIDHGLAFNLAINCKNQRICNEKLMKYIHDLAYTDEKYCLEYGISLLVHLFKFKFSFIDHVSFASLILESNHEKAIKLIQSNRCYLIILLIERLIMHRIYDSRLFELLDVICQYANQNEKIFSFCISDRLYRGLCFSLVHFTMYSTIEEDMKNKIIDQFNRIISIADTNCGWSSQCLILPTEDRLAHARLSNGLFLKSAAIYDHKIKDLISMTVFKDHLNCIDKAPLTKNQELLSISTKIVYETEFGSLERVSFTENNRILTDLKIKTIEIPYDDLSGDPEFDNRLKIWEAIKIFCK